MRLGWPNFTDCVSISIKRNLCKTLGQNFIESKFDISEQLTIDRRVPDMLPVYTRTQRKG